MNPDPTHSRCRLDECFRLRFQRRLADFLARDGSVAEGFGVIWEKTLEEVPVDEEAQGQLYRGLIQWAKRAEFFTLPNEGREAVRVADDQRGVAASDAGMVRAAREYEETWRRLTQEAHGEIQHFHLLAHGRRVLVRHARRLADDFQNVYAKTKALRSRGIS